MQKVPTLARLTKLREIFDRIHISGYIIPTEDAHRNEYIAECDMRRSYISGFTGSAGTAVVTLDKAAMWVDGRYHLQAEAQMDDNWTLMRSGLPNVPTEMDWLIKVTPANAAIGFDPDQLPYRTWKQMFKDLGASGRQLRPVESGNLVDQIWEERPARPNNPLKILPLSFTGETWPNKINLVREQLRAKCCDSIVISALDEIAWLLNLRGSDITHNPVFYAHLIVTLTEVQLFMDDKKRHATPGLGAHLTYPGVKVVINAYEEIIPAVRNLVENSCRVWLDPFLSYSIVSRVPKSRRVFLPSPVGMMKAVKRASELEGIRRVHILDAVALCDYLSWLEEALEEKKIVTELSGAEVLDRMRSEMEEYVSLSFDTISASGRNGAIIHYKPTPESDAPITQSNLYLVDSGAQYESGTTDVTRTVHFGKPTQEEIDNHTLVLKGHLMLQRQCFPAQTVGSRLDVLARSALWERGLDYLHGTGHGVGAFLNVHEGPVGISGRRQNAVEAALQEGNVVTIEPGFYKENAYGIRVENVVFVVKAGPQNMGLAREVPKGWLAFEPITLVPISAKLINLELLSREEVDWLNQYHAKVREVIGHELKIRGRSRAYNWLMRETVQLG